MADLRTSVRRAAREAHRVARLGGRDERELVVRPSSSEAATAKIIGMLWDSRGRLGRKVALSATLAGISLAMAACSPPAAAGLRASPHVAVCAAPSRCVSAGTSASYGTASTTGLPPEEGEDDTLIAWIARLLVVFAAFLLVVALARRIGNSRPNGGDDRAASESRLVQHRPRARRGGASGKRRI